MEQEDYKRIQALLNALTAGRAQFEEIKASEWKKVRPGDHSLEEPAFAPSFAVDEIYDLQPGKKYQRLPADRSGVQLSLSPVWEETTSGELLPVPEESACDRIAAGDNLDYMVWLLREKKMAGKIQLIYVDPPFFSGAKYLASVQISGRNGKKSPVLKVGAYEDKWGHDLQAYLEMLAVRFYLMRELLSDTGSLWVHLDWHGSHYVKMMLDEIFGPDLFINEVAWTYKSGGASKRSFAKKHDTLLYYAKTKDYKFHQLKEKSYNRDFKPYRFKGVEEFQDEQGWYTMVNMKDVWNIDMVGRTSGERMGYATQKPEKLLERIVDACTDPGDLCADFFAGTGTLGAVCGRKGRPYILCDDGDAAIGSQILRMVEQANMIQETSTAACRPFLVERPVLAYEVRPRARAQVAVREGHLMLDRYQPDLTQVQERDREIVAEYINENSLDLVSFWSVDMHHEKISDPGSGDPAAPRQMRPVHVCRHLLSGDDIIPLPEDRISEGNPLPAGISVVGYDIFGGRFKWTEE